MKNLPFDTKDRQYKSQYGACRDGQTVTFRVLLHNDARAHRVFFKIRKDGEDYSVFPLDFEKAQDQYFNWYKIDYTASEGLYFYKFYYESDYGDLEITRFDCGEGKVASNGGEWQLTVTEKEFSTPSNFKGGLIYQIFPDRFRRSGKPHKDVPKDRFIETDWMATPEYRQGEGLLRLGNDYYGGDLQGVTSKLPYLADLGVSIIYLNPIFEAHSNHRYNTADYFKIDPLLGTEKDLETLCKKAKKYGISIILDGVFSHTGDDSIYFNKYSRYPENGAYNSKDSEFYNWYGFKNWPDDYESWWGIMTLPEVIEENEKYTEFICGENGVLRYWLRKGISGWRLDVADELPDCFLDNIKKAIKAENKDALIIGEVWEDATDKISYGIRRRYLRGKQLDSVMNYPFANAIMNFVKGGNSKDFFETVLKICDSYPKQCLDLLMNHIGTHDTVRALTALAGEDAAGRGRDWQEKQVMSISQKQKGITLLKLCAVLQYTLPGIPSLYYGDEAGLYGYGDPFCRATYPWGNEDIRLLDFYKKLGIFRKETECLKDGIFTPVNSNLGLVAYKRVSENQEILVAVNRWCDLDKIEIGKEWDNAEVIFGRNSFDGTLTVDGLDFVILRK